MKEKKKKKTIYIRYYKLEKKIISNFDQLSLSHFDNNHGYFL